MPLPERPSDPESTIGPAENAVRNGGRRPAILMILYNAGLAGGPRITSNLAQSLSGRADIHAIVPSPGYATTCLQSRVVSLALVPREPVRATLNPIAHWKYLFRLPGTVAAYVKVIRKVQPDVVHVDSLYNLPALIAARISRVPALLYLQEIAFGVLRGTLAHVAGMLADRIVGLSKAAVAPLVRMIAQHKLAVVYGGTEVGSQAHQYRSDGWVTLSGRLSEDKDPATFVRAARLIYARRPDSKFMICGLTVPGRERFEKQIEQQITNTGIPRDRFVVTRDLADIRELIQQSSVVVSCCQVETFGLAVLEAMAQGVPVIVPASGGFPEFITHEQTGLLYRPGDADELAASVIRVLRDSALAERLGVAAHGLVEERFTPQQMARAMEEQYRILAREYE